MGGLFNRSGTSESVCMYVCVQVCVQVCACEYAHTRTKPTAEGGQAKMVWMNNNGSDVYSGHYGNEGPLCSSDLSSR